MTAHSESLGSIVLSDTLATFKKQRDLAERALSQTSDEDFFRTINAESNSIAIIVKHVGGNLLSRWTDFLTADGEKPTRDRDDEFIVGTNTDRARIMALWSTGWDALARTFSELRADDLTATVVIRGESMPAVAAMNRAVAHISQHVGQIVMLAKHYRSADWKTLSIPRGKSGDWQTATSR